MLNVIESPQLSRIRDARAGLLASHPFFGVLALKLRLEIMDKIPTAGVTNTAMMWNPAFIDKSSNLELKGVVAHEVLHLALCHHARMGHRHPMVWNIAADYAINQSLIDTGLTLPKNCLLDAKYKDMSAERIYEELMKTAKFISMSAPGDGDGDGQPQPGDGEGQGWGEFTAPGPAESAEATAAEREWQQNACDAMKAAKAAGKMPANIEKEIDAILKPRADWKSLLRRFCADQVRVQQTWNRPNKRFYPSIYMPGKYKDGMGTIALMVDTSGSIYGVPETLAVFQAEFNAIISDIAPGKVIVIYCDAAVNKVDSFEEGEEVVLRPAGGGGTDFRPPFEYLAEHGITPACAVYFTDLMGGFPESEVEYPALWAVYGGGDARAPWGETVRLDG